MLAFGSVVALHVDEQPSWPIESKPNIPALRETNASKLRKPDCHLILDCRVEVQYLHRIESRLLLLDPNQRLEAILIEGFAIEQPLMLGYQHRIIQQKLIKLVDVAEGTGLSKGDVIDIYLV